MAGALDSIRLACAQVADRARLVHIDRDRLATYATSLPAEPLASIPLDPRFHFLGQPHETVAYVLTLDTVNFGSGYFPHLRKRDALSGYFTIALSLKEHFDAHGPPTARDLVRLTPADCARIFGQEGIEGPAQELMALFARALQDLGSFLLRRFQGEFVALVEAAGGSAERLVALLAEMPLFRDVASYQGTEVPFYKRAQIAASDLATALPGHPLGSFVDLDRLTMFADNLVPHVLRLDGVLRYEESLVERIERGELIAAGSPEEVEIRACAVYAVELLVAERRRAGRPLAAREIDHYLWHRGQQPFYKARPRHRTRTVFY